MKGYAWFVAKYPFLVAGAVVITVVGCSVAVLMTTDLPDFSDPIKGFETRGTAIKARTLSQFNLLKSGWTVVGNVSRDGNFTQTTSVYNTEITQSEDLTTQSDMVTMTTTASTEEKEANLCNTRNLKSTWIPKIVFESKGRKNLFTAEALKSMCKVEDRVSTIKDSKVFSIARHAARMSNVSCLDLTDDHVEYVKSVFSNCTHLYHSGNLSKSCTALKQSGLYEDNSVCCEEDLVYEALYFFTDDEFMGKNNPDATFLTYAMSYISTCTQDIVGYYKDYLEHADLSHNGVKVTGIDIGWEKADLFRDYLIQDLLYFGIAMLIIIIIMCIYMRSLTLTIATILNIIFSFMLAYFIYFIVLRFKFFPFMNVLSGLVLIAIGADDIFIFYDTWFQARDDILGTPMEEILAKTFHHAILSIFITSLTTAAAFISNAVSNITAIKCFGVFSGVAVLANFIMMATWVPAVFVLWSKCNFKLCRKLCNGDRCVKCIHGVTNCISTFFNKIMPLVLTRGWPLWILFFCSLGTAGIVLVFFHPRLMLPSSQDFQLFASNMPLERYTQVLKHRFRCIQEAKNSKEGITVHIMWGLKAIDNGNWLDPTDTGTLVTDDTFSLDDQDSQQWMMKFCDTVKNQTFFNKKILQSQDCLMGVYRREISAPCVSPAQTGCCNLSLEFQNASVFNQCFHRTQLKALYMYNSSLQRVPLGHAYFDSSNKIKAFEMVIESNQIFSTAFNEMDDFYNEIEQFISNQLDTAPDSLKGGWFVCRHENLALKGGLDFYDLQRSLSTGTYIAIGVSLAFACAVMLLTSFNVIITVFAILNITLSIFATVGSLVLLGWELNILESVTLSLGVGLSIDFSIHYGMAYRLSNHKKRDLRIEDSLKNVGAAVTMAAVTTFIAGAAVMPSRIVSYTQLGTFLMLVMLFSWTFSTFFFQSLCAAMGPQGRCGQIPLPACCQKTSRENIEYSSKVIESSNSSLTAPNVNTVSNGTTTIHEMLPETRFQKASLR